MIKYNVYKSAELIKSVVAANIADAIELVGMLGATVRDEMAFQWFTLGEKSYAMEIIPADQGTIMQAAANTVTIIISSDNDDGEQFAAWLQQQGNTASVGNSTGNYIMGMLWNSYCNA